MAGNAFPPCKRGHSVDRWYSYPTPNLKSRKGYGYCRDCFNEDRKVYRRHLRMEVILAYGGKCACCGEWRYEFLALDHINGDGAKIRREMNVEKELVILKDSGYPESYRILCHNCNQSRGFFGYCPHTEED